MSSEKIVKEQVGSLLRRLESNKNHRDLARLLTLLESEGSRALAYSELLEPTSFALRIGITGPPGAGKSTLVSRLIGEFRKEGKHVGVIAVDPTSPFTKGAILGDRLRFHEHATDPQVFIRSVGSRGSLGGVSASVFLMARAFDFFGFDVVLIETVGVGQSEMEIMNIADLVSVVVVPEFGDSIQAMKAGLLEIANVFVMNKSDRPGADTLVRELQEWNQNVPVFKTVATDGTGVAELADFLEGRANSDALIRHRFSSARLQAEARALIQQSLAGRWAAPLAAVDSPKKLYSFLSHFEKSL